MIRMKMCLCKFDNFYIIGTKSNFLIPDILTSGTKFGVAPKRKDEKQSVAFLVLEINGDIVRLVRYNLFQNLT